jgi:hypothetical protein
VLALLAGDVAMLTAGSQAARQAPPKPATQQTPPASCARHLPKAGS